MSAVAKMIIIVGFSIPYIVSACLTMERYRQQRKQRRAK